MNNKFLESVRHHRDLIETTATHQIISDAHGQLEFAYAWSAAQAEESAQIFREIAPHRGEPTIHESGEFIPHYTYDDE